MDAADLLIYLTRHQMETLFATARKVPADKLEWQPGPASRSVLDQLQEVATAGDEFSDSLDSRKIEFAPDRLARWRAERSKITSLDELERIALESVERLSVKIRATPPSELANDVDIPFPGTYKVADLLAYCYWNASYHEGQIVYLQTLLENPPVGPS